MRNEMNPLGTKRSAQLAALAGPQWGCVTAVQLIALGFTRREIHRMVERGQLIRMHRGVYVLGALSPAPEQRWAAALLAAGKGAVLSHTASAGNFGWIQPREIIEISAPRKRRGDENLTIHRRASIEVRRRNGLPTTTVAQTLLDLAATGWSIDRFTQEAAATGQVSLDDLRAFAAQRRGARGANRLAEAAGQPLVRSMLEADVLNGWVRRE
jgi:predicted transcriptional regulator of viral defense system